MALSRASVDYTDIPREEKSLDGSDITLLDRTCKQRRRSRPQGRQVIIGLALASILAGLFTLMGSTIVRVQKISKDVHLFPTGVELGDCGETVEEARAKNCIFDPMSFIWVKPACYHPDLVNDFFNRTEWQWYSDPKLEQKIPMEEMFNGDHPRAFAPRKYHPIHCTYMWRKMHAVVSERLPMDSDLRKPQHTLHCERVLLNDVLHEDVECTPDMICPTLVRATWTSCGYY
jgi:hypothetical protein